MRKWLQINASVDQTPKILNIPGVKTDCFINLKLIKTKITQKNKI